MITRILIAICFLYTGNTLFAQAYMTTAGLRLGTDWGLTVKQRIGLKSTAEIMLLNSLVRKENQLSLTFQRHTPLIGRRFNLYTGAGAHYGWPSQKQQYGINEPEFINPIGLSLIGGAEMTIGPINLSYDFKPAFNVVGGDKFFYLQSGASLRYVLAKNNKCFEKRRKLRDHPWYRR
jgi:hypothetical protein